MLSSIPPFMQSKFEVALTLNSDSASPELLEYSRVMVQSSVVVKLDAAMLVSTGYGLRDGTAGPK
jgi:hypothetical protein